ncbi:hypothetical protein K3U18_003542 [Salmonella enterica]|nr:hypothetical protein [Salmonella enterica]EGI5345095.1 hypothetical protein [Salmonella enterica subsp. enterica serovar Sandiego]ECV2871170.1 hypothetical protein [Salmonella enterica]EHX2262813.1 hypothetical protein [Salmonella enterica]EJG3839487.1 hypothetical protein [Salmonella enterica]
MAKAKFFVFEKLDDNKYYWEFRWQKQKFSGGPFENRKSALKDLETVIPLIGDAPMCRVSGEIDEKDMASPGLIDKYPLYFMLHTDNNDRWLWRCCRNKDNKTLFRSSDEAFIADGFSSFDDAMESAKKLRSIIEHAEIVDGAGVMIPYMHFSPEFSQKYEIGDMHPSYEFIKKNKL